MIAAPGFNRCEFPSLGNEHVDPPWCMRQHWAPVPANVTTCMSHLKPTRDSLIDRDLVASAITRDDAARPNATLRKPGKPACHLLCGFIVAAAAAIFATSPFTASAADAARCNPAGTQVEINACAADKLAEADRQLNAVYQSLLKKQASNPAFEQKLRAAQRAWITFRDAELAATFACGEPNAAACWGSSLSMRYASYKAKLTNQRTERLRRWLAEGPPADDFAPQ